MTPPARLLLTPDQRRELIDAAAGRTAVDLALVGGQVLNVFTGAVSPAAVGILHGRIAWVRPAPGPARRRAAMDGTVLVPGLIDPHCHVDIVCTPSAFVEAAALRGTTTACADAHMLLANLDDEALDPVLDALEQAAMKVLWGVRPSGEGGGDDDPTFVPAERVERLARRPGVVSSGELTAWHALRRGEHGMTRVVDAAARAGLRLDGHLPGASGQTLAQAAAAGVTSDHEAIHADELAARVEHGLWAMVRHSSLRPDGVELGRAVVERELPVSRLLLTADGTVPGDLLTGHVDRTVRKVVEGGVDPVDAVRMATINAATYFGLDAHLGAIAPGRCADILAVDGLESFQPAQVFCDGALVEPGAAAGGPVDWASMTVPIARATLTPGLLVDACRQASPVRIDGIITRAAPDRRPGATYLALVARDGSTIVGTTTDDLDIAAAASTITGEQDVLLIGRDPQALVAAYDRVVDIGGGIACGGVEVPLPTFGQLYAGSVEQLAAELDAVEQAAGVAGVWPAFNYRTFFLTLPALPGVALTRRGMIETRTGNVVSRSRPLTPARAAHSPS